MFTGHGVKTRALLLLFVLLVCAAPASAQTFPIKIHGALDCSFYVSDSTPIDPGVTCHLPGSATVPLSAQAHMTPADLTVLGQPGGTTGHTHVECFRPPIYGVINTAIRLACQFQLYHVTGHIDRVEGRFLRSIIWDATGTSTPPALVGDPMGVLIFTVRATFDPDLLDTVGNPVPGKGWWQPALVAVTKFTNGQSETDELILPFYSERNPLAEPAEERWTLEARTTGNPVSVWGTNSAGFRNVYVPLAPITAPWTVPVLSYGYGTSCNCLPTGTFEQRLDMNLHAGIEGTLLATEQSFGGNPNGNLVTFDPSAGLGDHKMAFSWDQDGDAVFVPNQKTTAWLVLPFTVGTGSAPPPVDVCPNLSGVQAVVPAGMQLINGQCVAPPPVQTWQPNTLQPERNGDLERLCASDGKCVVIGTLTTP